jgi:hypothetical protein
MKERCEMLRKGIDETSPKRARLHFRNCRKCERLIKTTSIAHKAVCIECNEGTYCGHEGGYVE